MNGKDFAQDAADRVNEAARRYGSPLRWSGSDYGTSFGVTALADALAELAEAKADLREIDRIAVEGGWLDGLMPRPKRAATIAAKHRVETDPLLIEARKLVAERTLNDQSYVDAVMNGSEDQSQAIQNCLKALKRGIELAAELDKRGLVVGVKS